MNTRENNINNRLDNNIRTRVILDKNEFEKL